MTASKHLLAHWEKAFAGERAEVEPLRHPQDVIERWAKGAKLPVTDEQRTAWYAFDSFISSDCDDAAQYNRATSDLRRDIIAAFNDGMNTDEICRTVALRATAPLCFGRRSWGEQGPPYWDGLHPSPDFVEKVIEAYTGMQRGRP